MSSPTRLPRSPQGALSFDGLRSLLSQAQSRRGAEARHTGARDAWQRYLAQKDVPSSSHFALADLLVSLYERNTSASREVLFQLARDAYLRFGLWGGLKRIYKLAEERHAAEMFGVLAWCFDTERSQLWAPARSPRAPSPTSCAALGATRSVVEVDLFRSKGATTFLVEGISSTSASPQAPAPAAPTEAAPPTPIT